MRRPNSSIMLMFAGDCCLHLIGGCGHEYLPIHEMGVAIRLM